MLIDVCRWFHSAEYRISQKWNNSMIFELQAVIKDRRI